jgi:hypothetical protein
MWEKLWWAGYWMWCEPAGQLTGLIIAALIVLAFLWAWIFDSRRVMLCASAALACFLVFLFWWVVPLIHDILLVDINSH